MKIKVINLSKTNKLPEYKTSGSAGMDILANLDNPVTINPGKRACIGSGLKMAIPEGYEIQIRPRSGLALREGLTVLNTPGTIDSDYRDEIGVILINQGEEPVVIEPGERIAQLVLNRIEKAELIEIDDFSEIDKQNDRGGGYGHTGK